MSEDKKDEVFLNRWSRLKHEDAKPKPPVETEKPAAPLPPVDQLTPDSDFTGFMKPKVGDALRRVALKKLFSDPHFNIADPFEPFSGDWTVGEGISDEMLATLNQTRTLLFSDEQKQQEKEREEKALAEKQQAEKPAQPKADEPGKQDA